MSTYVLDGPATIGDTSTLTTVSGYVTLGGDTNTNTITGNGSSVLGGSSMTNVLSSIGGVSVGGVSRSVSIVGDGGVSVSSSGTIGLSSSDNNLVLIGGINTLLYGSGSVSIGSSTQTVRYQPTNPKLYLKDNSISTKLNTVFTTPGTLTAAAVSGGVIQFTTTAGAYTLPTTAQLCTELLDTSATAFVGTPRHLFQVTFYNNTAGNITIALGTGQTFTNGTSPITIRTSESRTWSFWFTSPTAMLIEDMKAGANGNNSFAEPFYTTNNRAIISGTGNTLTGISSTCRGGLFGGILCAPIIPTDCGSVSIAGSNTSGTYTVGGFGSATIGGYDYSCNITGDGAVVVGGVFVSSTISGSGNVVLGSISTSSAISGTGCAAIGGTGRSATIAGTGNVSIGGQTVGYPLNGQGNVTVGGQAMSASSIASNVFGCACIGGSTGTYAISSSSHGFVTLGGYTSTISGSNARGAVVVGGFGLTTTIQGTNIAIGAGVTIGLNNTETNLICIGGTNTTLYGSGSNVIGPSTQTVRYQPTNPKLYLKDSPIYTVLNTTFTTPGTLTAAAISGGLVQFTTTAGAYTLPTTVDLCTELLDTSATAFTGDPRHVFNVVFYNNTAGTVTIALGTGQTFTNGVSPISIANGESRTWSFWFTSPTAMLIEDMKSGANGNSSFSEPFYTTNSRSIISGTGNTITSISSTSGGGSFGGSGNAPNISTATGSVYVGGSACTSTISGVGAVLSGGSTITTTISGTGAVCEGGSGNTGTMAGTGTVRVGGSSVGGTMAGTGSVIVGGSTVTPTSSGVGTVCVGGNSNIVTLAGNGSVMVGGTSDTVTVNGLGGVSISGAGTVGSVAADAGLVLIGGSGTTLAANGGASSGNICIGDRTMTQTFSPSATQTYIKANPLYSYTNTNFAAVATMTAAQLIGGYITTTGTTFTLTFPSATSMYQAFVENTATTFSAFMSFHFIIKNNSSGTITLAA